MLVLSLLVRTRRLFHLNSRVCLVKLSHRLCLSNWIFLLHIKINYTIHILIVCRGGPCHREPLQEWKGLQQCSRASRVNAYGRWSRSWEFPRIRYVATQIAANMNCPDETFRRANGRWTIKASFCQRVW